MRADLVVLTYTWLGATQGQGNLGQLVKAPTSAAMITDLVFPFAGEHVQG